MMDYYQKQEQMRRVTDKMLSVKTGISLSEVKLAIMSTPYYTGGRCIRDYLELQVECGNVYRDGSCYFLTKKQKKVGE